MFALINSNKSGTFSHKITFEPRGASVVIRRFMRDELLGNWAGDHGQPQRVPAEVARDIYREFLDKGFQRV
jgi:hypothetical protein